jgi:hypothetical protein
LPDFAAEVAELAKLGAIDPAPAKTPGRKPKWATYVDQVRVRSLRPIVPEDQPGGRPAIQDLGVAGHRFQNANALVAWLFDDALVAKFNTAVDEMPAGGIMTEERAAREADLLAEILDLERREEACVEAIEQTGLDFQRRAEADPRAVLGLASSLPRLAR